MDQVNWPQVSDVTRYEESVRMGEGFAALKDCEKFHLFQHEIEKNLGISVSVFNMLKTFNAE